MKRPILLRETNPAGRMLSFRYGGCTLDVVEKSDSFRLYQIGRKRFWFACRLNPHAKKPPIFLFRRTCKIKWMIGDLMFGFTMEPLSLDDYWRAKGWLTSDQNTFTQITTSGSGESQRRELLD